MQKKAVVSLTTGLEDTEAGHRGLPRGRRRGRQRPSDADVPHQGGDPARPRTASPRRRVDGLPAAGGSVARYAAAGGGYLVCPICFDARKLDKGDSSTAPSSGGTVPMWQWIGDERRRHVQLLKSARLWVGRP